MDPNQVASLTTILAPFLGARTAGIVSLLVTAVVVLSAIMTKLPVASATSPGWYRVVYGVLAWVTFNFGNAAPVPANGLAAGSPVPAVPASKSATSGK